MNICVFASSSPVGEPYQSAVVNLGCELGEAGHGLVFGGFSNGLMGAIADGFCKAQAPIVGVIPASLTGNRPIHGGCTQIVPVESLGPRKVEMERLSQAFVAVPGGIGTLDELFDVLAMAVCGEIDCPIVLFDVDGFYEQLYTSLQSMEQRGFLKRNLNDVLTLAHSPEEVLAALS